MADKIMDLINSENFMMDILLLLLNIVVIVVLGYLIAKIANKVVMKYLDKKGTKQSLTIKNVASSIINYFMLFVVVTGVLDLFNVNFTSVIALAGFGSVALGFGAQSLVKDVITGFFILAEDQFGVDDAVEINAYSGRVEKIGLRTTLLRNVVNNEVYIIPNSEIKAVTNRTRDYQRVSSTMKIAYFSDKNKIKTLFENALLEIQDDKRIISKISVGVFPVFEEEALNIRVSCDVENHCLYAITVLVNDILNETKYKYDLGKHNQVSEVNIRNLS